MSDEVKTDAELDTGIDPSDGVDEKADDAPVYDERGNVRPRGTQGARPRTYEERVAIAERIAAGEEISPEPAPVKTPAKAGRKK